MSDRIEIVMKALRTGALSDRLNAEAVHALSGTTSVASMAAIMQAAAIHIETMERVNAAIKRHVNDLEAQLDALRNPPYRIVVRDDFDYYSTSPTDYQASVWLEDYKIPIEFEWHSTPEDARAEAQAFIDKLTAPFGAKRG